MTLHPGSDLVSVLLSVTFGCGLFIAAAHVHNRAFIAPVYDVVANLVAFASSAAAATLLGHATPALLSTAAVGCWMLLAVRTAREIPTRRTGMPARLDS